MEITMQEKRGLLAVLRTEHT